MFKTVGRYDKLMLNGENQIVSCEDTHRFGHGYLQGNVERNFTIATLIPRTGTLLSIRSRVKTS